MNDASRIPVPPERMRITLGPATWLGRFWVATRGALVTEIQFGVSPPDPQADGAPVEVHSDPPLEPVPEGDDPLGQEVARQIVDFLHADRRSFHLPLDWTVLPPAHADILRTLYECIRWGDIVNYGELAAMAGYPGAARAAGTACTITRSPSSCPPTA
jgi:methylated-DNA-[protein]-cysteine S-methyltransferase